MKYIVPYTRKNNEPINSYINKWNMNLIVFKRLLRNKINRSKLLCRKQSLLNQPNIQWVITDSNYDILLIVNSYVNHLQCLYDSHNNYCYYEVPKTIRCPYTVTPIDTVIRTLEYGGTNMAPLYWIRPVFSEFIKITNNK